MAIDLGKVIAALDICILKKDGLGRWYDPIEEREYVIPTKLAQCLLDLQLQIPYDERETPERWLGGD